MIVIVLNCQGFNSKSDAFAVHYGGGVVGVLATPVFMNGGIVHWTRCAEQTGDCDYYEFKGIDLFKRS